MRDKKDLLDFMVPFNLILRYGAVFGLGEGLCGGERWKGVGKKRGQTAKSTKCPPVWAHLGSNQGPTDYESATLTN